MTPPPPRLKEQLNRFSEILEREEMLSLSREERQDALASATELRDRLQAVEGEYLTIGLLGGTGVGKSSLMNALAGSPISSVSHRRPHTDRVIIYRHEDAPPVPAPPPDAIPWQEILHRADPVRHVLLCDLPDFDSLLTAHRESVLAFLANLDLLVWVTSPEKYADRRLYEFLEQVPKARENFLFVLNKADLLFEDDPGGEGHHKAAAASERFAGHLGEAGIHDPVLFVVSAQEALESGSVSAWNQFPLLRQQVFQLRNAKQVRIIKAENLDAEAAHLFAHLTGEVRNLERLSSALDRTVQQLKEDRSTWERLGGETLTPWLESRGVRDALRPPRDALPLSGPGLALALLFLRPPRPSEGPAETDQVWRRLSPPESVVSVLRRRMGWIEDRLARSMLEEHLPSGLRERVLERLRPRERFEDLGERLFHVASNRASRPLLTRMTGFRMLQALTWGLLLLLLIFALGEGAAWRELLRNPGWRSGLGLLSSFVQTLFSGKGVAALGSYALLNLFFGVRFFLSYRRRLERATDRAVRSFRQGMIEVWTEELDAVVEELARLRNEAQARGKELSELAGRASAKP